MDRRRLTLFEQGIGEFNQARFFEAHESWEQAWLSAKGAEKALLGGLIQAAAACVKWQRGEPKGTLRLCTAAINKLYGVDEQDALGLVLPPFIDALVRLRKIAEETVAGERTVRDSIELPRLEYNAPDDDAEPVGGFSVFPAVRCPYCGEEVEVAVEAVGAPSESFVQDCSVCCRPWAVHVSRDGGEVDVTLARDDD